MTYAMSEVIKVVVVDDEPLARRGLQLRLEDYADIDVVEQAHDGLDALHVISACQPDVIFVDIEMPRLNGFDLIEKLQSQSSQLPYIVFITAHDDFACKAYEKSATDYLLKPVSNERLKVCVDKIKAKMKEANELQQCAYLETLLKRKTGHSLTHFIESLEQQSQASSESNILSVKSGTEWLRVKLDSIHWIEAAGDYMCLHTSEGQVIIRKTLKELEQQLNKKLFPRVNRSAIVNVEKVTKLTPNSNGEYIAQLSTGDKVKVGRKYRVNMAELGLA
jgi:two-component system LytT family response regulator